MLSVVVAKCAERCSGDTQEAFRVATLVGGISVSVTHGKKVRNEACISFVSNGERTDWVVVLRNTEHRYSLMEQHGLIPGFDEKALLEFGKACICAVRKTRAHG